MNFENITSNKKEEKKNIISKNLTKILRSRLILQKIFKTIPENIELNVIRYNKNIQQRLNININDYIEYGKIEIEIIPLKNCDGEFISYPKEDKSYYHIYFNNNIEEAKRNYFYEKENIRNIKIIIDCQVKSFYQLFYYCRCIESIHFKKFLNKRIINMKNMFYRCSSLKQINFSKFITDNVTNMRGMFKCCSSLKELNLSNFNTKNVTDMKLMFYGCSSLEKINLFNFNTNNVTDMGAMFYQCSSLKELNLSNFNTSKVSNMCCMFDRCYNLKEINLSSFNLNNTTKVKNMFEGCSNEIKSKAKPQINIINIINEEDFD